MSNNTMPGYPVGSRVEVIATRDMKWRSGRVTLRTITEDESGITTNHVVRLDDADGPFEMWYEVSMPRDGMIRAVEPVTPAGS